VVKLQKKAILKLQITKTKSKCLFVKNFTYLL